MRLKDKVAIVTGGAQGIGKAVVQRFVSEGAKVLVADIQEKGADLESDGVVLRRTDVTKKDEVEAMVAAAVDAFGRLDIIVNNAWAYRDGRKSVETITKEDWQHGFDLAMSATLWSTQAALPNLKEHGGSLVSVASVHGVQAASAWLPYDPVKGGLIHLVKALAVELGRYNIRVNAVSPGLIVTDEVRERIKQKRIHRESYAYPLGRPGTSEEVASTILFLASDESSFITGQNLVVDGGMTTRLPDDVLAQLAGKGVIE